MPRTKKGTWLSPREIDTIRSMTKKGYSSAHIARHLGRSQGCVYRVAKGQTYGNKTATHTTRMGTTPPVVQGTVELTLEICRKTLASNLPDTAKIAVLKEFI